MSRHRYQAIKRYLHVALALDTNAYKDKEEEMERTWWYKVEPLASILRTAYAKYYIPCSSVSIDELMIRCFGRSAHIYKMPNKPIAQGYKLFTLVDHGYIYSFVWSSRKQGLGELVKHPKLTPTGSMVLGLV
jgi:Transposase IS4